MIEIVDVTNEADDLVVKYVYESMMCVNTSGRVYSDLTIEEVRDEILIDNPISVIKRNGVVIGICNPNSLVRELYEKLELDKKDKYVRLGIIYLGEEHRNKGYGKEVLAKFLEMNVDKKVIYITHQSNIESNKVASSLMPYVKDYLNSYNWKRYNVYIK